MTDNVTPLRPDVPGEVDETDHPFLDASGMPELTEDEREQFDLAIDAIRRTAAGGVLAEEFTLALVRGMMDGQPVGMLCVTSQPETHPEGEVHVRPLAVMMDDYIFWKMMGGQDDE